MAVKGLGYTKGSTPPLSLDDRSFREFIVWLEDTKIRALPMEARGGLRAVEASSVEWGEAFDAFVKEVGCELTASGGINTERVFDYLLEQAVALDYRDNADNLGAIVKDLKMATIGSSGGGVPPPSKRQRVIPPGGSEDRPVMRGAADPALRSRLVELAGVLRVEVEAGAGVEALLEACTRGVERFVAPFWMSHVDPPAAMAAANQGATRGGNQGGKGGGGKGSVPKASWNLKVADFPSGIELGTSASGGPLEAAVNVLRVLHVNDLRVLQSAVDALLVQMQEYTSNPKTDSKLGRVGTG